MKEIYILGVGHNTPVYIDLVEACGYKIGGLYHFDSSRNGESDHGYPILGSYDDLFGRKDIADTEVALSQGDNKIRAELFSRLKKSGARIPTLIHPTAIVSRFATLGEGAVVHINGVVHPDVSIGDNTVISLNSSVGHSTSVGSNCYVAFGALVGAYAHICDYVFIGIGANIISGKVDVIGENAYVGAGALVTKSVEAYSVVAGSPAKKIKDLPKR